ncbi:MAG: hypothetical protein EOO36_01815 [Cytophagaceae bacterium]|nr:MAG: hypothetical protein EOO36_01815 [Cytophagaceae bacterium]
MRAHIEPLPHSYLLTLHPSGAAQFSLAEALRRVLHSEQPRVWVDCRHLKTLPAGALQRLRRYATRLWRHGGYLVLCHLPAAARTELATDSGQPLAASLLDAEQYGLVPPSPYCRSALGVQGVQRPYLLG